MTDHLEIHEASFEERKQIYANVFDFWQWADTVEEHVEMRMESVQHQRARWYAGYLDGELVSSLGAYPIDFSFNGECVPGISIGSVHTLEAYRGRGLVPQLMRRVEELEVDNGARLSMLYSDISPGYYARLGYQRCPSWYVWLDVENLADAETEFELEEFMVADQLDEVKQRYEYYLNTDFAIARSDDYWQYVLNKSEDDIYCWVSFRGSRLGYVVAGAADGDLIVRDYAVSGGSGVVTDCLPELAKIAAQSELKCVGGWLAAPATLPSTFRMEARSAEITMIKHLQDAELITEQHRVACAEMREIDHV
ncbi:MAG: hypothetical protein CMJ78_15450 [Planctomycetaceae bacterium]|nr:hypothetical protein [Planctomycetaceae bacterium]